MPEQAADARGGQVALAAGVDDQVAYLLSHRLDRAAVLLRETDAPLSAIARQTGYSTEFALAAAFRREYGVASGAFRRTHRRAQEQRWRAARGRRAMQQR